MSPSSLRRQVRDRERLHPRNVVRFLLTYLYRPLCHYTARVNQEYNGRPLVFALDRLPETIFLVGKDRIRRIPDRGRYLTLTQLRRNDFTRNLRLLNELIGSPVQDFRVRLCDFAPYRLTSILRTRFRLATINVRFNILCHVIGDDVTRAVARQVKGLFARDIRVTVARVSSLFVINRVRVFLQFLQFLLFLFKLRIRTNARDGQQRLRLMVGERIDVQQHVTVFRNGHRKWLTQEVRLSNRSVHSAVTRLLSQLRNAGRYVYRSLPEDDFRQTTSIRGRRRFLTYDVVDNERLLGRDRFILLRGRVFRATIATLTASAPRHGRNGIINFRLYDRFLNDKRRLLNAKRQDGNRE